MIDLLKCIAILIVSIIIAYFAILYNIDDLDLKMDSDSGYLFTYKRKDK